MDYKDRTVDVKDVKVTIDSEFERKDYVHRICLNLSNGPLNICGFITRDLRYVMSLVVR